MHCLVQRDTAVGVRRSCAHGCGHAALFGAALVAAVVPGMHRCSVPGSAHRGRLGAAFASVPPRHSSAQHHQPRSHLLCRGPAHQNCRRFTFTHLLLARLSHPAHLHYRGLHHLQQESSDQSTTARGSRERRHGESDPARPLVVHPEQPLVYGDVQLRDAVNLQRQRLGAQHPQH